MTPEMFDQFLIGHGVSVNSYLPHVNTYLPRPVYCLKMGKHGNKPKGFVLDDGFRKRVRETMRYAQCPTNSEFAVKIGLERATIGKWLNDDPPQKQLDALLLFHVCDILGISARWLATGQGEMIDGDSKRTRQRPMPKLVETA